MLSIDYLIILTCDDEGPCSSWNEMDSLEVSASSMKSFTRSFFGQAFFLQLGQDFLV